MNRSVNRPLATLVRVLQLQRGLDIPDRERISSIYGKVFTRSFLFRQAIVRFVTRKILRVFLSIAQISFFFIL